MTHVITILDYDGFHDFTVYQGENLSRATTIEVILRNARVKTRTELRYAEEDNMANKRKPTTTIEQDVQTSITRLAERST